MARKYDEFLAQLIRRPLEIQPVSEINHRIEGEDDGANGPMRHVLKVEFSGYQDARNGARNVPHVAEVLTCGHRTDFTLGSFPWQKPRKTANCFDCRKV